MQNETANRTPHVKTCHAWLASIPMGEKRCRYCGEKQLSPLEYRISQKFLHSRIGVYPATKLLLIVLVLLFIAMSIDIVTTDGYGLANALLEPPSELIYRWGAHLRGDFVWWRLITANFIHIGIIHIVFNAYALRYVSPYVERAYGGSLTLLGFMSAASVSELKTDVFGERVRLAGGRGG